MKVRQTWTSQVEVANGLQTYASGATFSFHDIECI